MDYCEVMGPGLAAHRHSASKTRVNALIVLRSIRGTLIMQQAKTAGQTQEKQA